MVLSGISGYMEELCDNGFHHHTYSEAMPTSGLFVGYEHQKKAR
jgi:hypothetical protein